MHLSVASVALLAFCPPFLPGATPDHQLPVRTDPPGLLWVGRSRMICSFVRSFVRSFSRNLSGQDNAILNTSDLEVCQPGLLSQLFQ